MPVRTDIHVLPWYSPRIVLIDAPSQSVTVQDVYDTLRAWEDSENAHTYEIPIIDAGGKEPLGGGVLVGVTATLYNARLMFAARHTVVESGTATTADAAGATLADTAADFVAANLTPGDLVFNRTDQSWATILSVNTTELFTFGLQGGSDNQWELGDSHECFRIYECKIDGGNLVALDDVGAEMEVSYGTFGTRVRNTSAASATIAQLEIDQLVERIESLRPSHRATGLQFYWDPTQGDDGNDGISDSTAVKTFAKAQTLCVAGRHDVIVALDNNPAGPTVTYENLNITVRTLSLRGPGFGDSFKILPANNALPTLSIGVRSVAVSGLRVDGDAGGSASANILASGADLLLLEDIITEHGANDGVLVTNCRLAQLQNVIPESNARHGIYLSDDTYEARLYNCKSHGNGGDGIRLDGTNVDECTITGAETTIYDNDQGIYLGAGAVGTLLSTTITVTNNANGDVVDLGTDTNYSGAEHILAFGGIIHIDPDGESGTAYPRGTQGRPVNNLADALLIADKWSIEEIHFKGTIVVTTDVSGFRFQGASTIKQDILFLHPASTTDALRAELCTVTSTLSGTNHNLIRCIVANITGVDGIIDDCGLFGTIAPSATGEILCKQSNAADNPVIIDLSSGGAIRAEISGDVRVVNQTGAQACTFSMNFGTLDVQSSCTGGTIDVAGVALVNDDSAGTVVTNNAINPQTIRDAVWDESLSARTTFGTMGGAINNLVKGLYRGAVHVDLTSAFSGTDIPVGTPQQPVNNLADARTIADNLGFRKYVLYSALPLAGVDHTLWGFEGVNLASAVILSGEDVGQSIFQGCFVSGAVGAGNVLLAQCSVGALTGFQGTIASSALTPGGLSIVGQTSVTDCTSGVPGNDSPTITFADPAAGLNLRGYSGGIKFYGMAAGNIGTAEFVAGRCRFDTSCVGGEMNVRGIVSIPTDLTTIGTTVRLQAQIDESSIAASVWDALEASHSVNGSLGLAVARTRKVAGSLQSLL